MFKYKNDICEYIRAKMNEIPKVDEEMAFERYLNKNNLILINKKTLSIVNTLEEVDDLKEIAFEETTTRTVGYCQYDSCLGQSDIICVTCILDYMLSIDYLKLVKKEN